MSEILDNQNITNRHRKTFFFLRRLKKLFASFGTVIAMILVLLGIAFGITRTSAFSLQDIEIIGDFKNINLGEVKKLAPISLGTNLFNIPLKEVEQNILKLKWVQSVSVRRQVPHTLWIYVKEHKPKAILLEQKLYFVSDEGKVFKEVEQEATRDLPVLTGFQKEDSLDKALSFIDFLEAQVDFSVFGLSEIHYNEASGFSIVTLTGPMEVKLGSENFETKLNRLKIVWAHLKTKVGRVRGIDLDYEDRAFVKL